MKLSLAILFAASAAFANQNLNQKVDSFLADINKVRMETFKIYDGKTPEEVKASVCGMLTPLSHQALELQQELLSERYPEKRRVNAAENVVKQTARTVQFCGDQSGLGEEERLYNLADVLSVLQQAGSLAYTLKKEPLPDEGEINCDYAKGMLRAAIDPSSERLWFVRLNENGQPEDRLPQELRIIEVYVRSFSYYKCKGCYDISFGLSREAPSALEARVRNFNLNLFDVTNTEPEQTWEDVSCWVKN